MTNTRCMTARLTLILCLLAPVVSSCRVPGSHVKDMATNMTANGTASGVYLYFREDQTISRTRCPDAGIGIYDRAHCTANKQSVAAKPFIDGISIGVGATMDEHAKNVQALYAQIKKIQDQLLQVLAAAPSVQAQIDALRPQINQAEAKIAALQSQVDGYDQQIALIKTRLATQNNVDLNVQLGKILDERGKVVAQQNEAKADEQIKRDQFIAANSSTLDQETYGDVEAQEKSYVEQLDSEKAQLASAMQELSDMNKTIAHIGNPTFTFNVLEGKPAFESLKPFARRFQGVFDFLFGEMGTICQTAGDVREHFLRNTSSPLVSKGVVGPGINSRFCVHTVQDNSKRLADGMPIDLSSQLLQGLQIAIADVRTHQNGATFAEAQEACASLTLGGTPRGYWKVPKSSRSSAVPLESKGGRSMNALAVYLLDSTMALAGAYESVWSASVDSSNPGYAILANTPGKNQTGWEMTLRQDYTEGVVCIGGD